MADFCKQCSLEIFQEDFADLAGLCQRDQSIQVICEGCGFTRVNHAGLCINPNCLKEHGKGHENNDK